LSGSVGPSERENPETELHLVPGTTPKGGLTALGTSVLPCLLCSWEESGRSGSGSPELLPGPARLAFRHPKRPRPGSLALCPVSSPLSDPPPLVPSHLTWPPHPAHPRYSLTLGGPRDCLPCAHWLDSLHPPSSLDNRVGHSAPRAPPPSRFKLL
jgi:hypothetical protein